MVNIKLLLGSIFIFSLGLVSADGDDCGMYNMMSGGYGYSGMFFGWLTGLLFLVALVLLIAWLIKEMQKK